MVISSQVGSTPSCKELGRIGIFLCFDQFRERARRELNWDGITQQQICIEFRLKGGIYWKSSFLLWRNDVTNSGTWSPSTNFSHFLKRQLNTLASLFTQFCWISASCNSILSKNVAFSKVISDQSATSIECAWTQYRLYYTRDNWFLSLYTLELGSFVRLWKDITHFCMSEWQAPFHVSHDVSFYFRIQCYYYRLPHSLVFSSLFW